MYYKQKRDVEIRELDGEIVILDDRNGYIHQFNETAAYVWRQCDGTCSTEEIARRFAAEYGLEDSVASRDVMQVIEKFCELELLSE